MDQDPLYSRYNEFKGWSESAAALQPEVFENVVAASGKTGPMDILEIGFGDGSFLDWARGQGHRVGGTEIRPEAVEAARARGHEVSLGDPGSKAVDLVVAIDVIEHLDREGLLSFFDAAERALKPGGRIVVRFPNGYSPFFGRHQHSDLTHVQPLTGFTVAQMAMLRGLRMVCEINPRPRPRRFRQRIKAFLAYRIRDLVEIILGYAYFGVRFPMDPNILVVLERSQAASEAVQVESPSRSS